MYRKTLIMNAGLLSAAQFVGRGRTRDQFFTYDSAAIDQAGNAMGRRLPFPCTTHDGRTVDSTGAFLVGELERLDQTMHEPLAEVSWQRDINLRNDVTIADETSSFTNTSFGSVGGLGTGSGIGNGKAWVGKNSNEIAQLSIDIGKTAQPLRPWALEVKYTVLELESAARVGRPVDQQKYDALQLKHQMDTDEQVYIGDTTTGDKGLLNGAGVTNVAGVAAGASGSPLWAQKTPDEILSDVNELLTSVWATSGYKIMPGKIGLAPTQYGYISTTKISQAGNNSILKYLLENNIRATAGIGGGQLQIVPMKWAVGTGSGGTIGTADGHDRMIAYLQEEKRVRFPMTPLQRTPVQYESIYHKSTYYGRLGVVEFVYPETIGYRDGY